MKKLVTGLHHVTSLSSSPQKTVDFYAGILGLRLVKKSINFDAPEVYHLYFGDEKGTPGTLMTFFPYPNIPKGRKGKGQLTVTSFSISGNSLDYWLKRLAKFQIKHEKPQTRFEDELFIYLEDYDGLGLELVVSNNDKRAGYARGTVPKEHAIKGFYGIALCEECNEKTMRLLVDEMDHVLIAEQGDRFRYSANEETSGFVDILCSPEAILGLGGTGTVHHVAFATATDATQLEAREKLVKFGLNVTPVIDRKYFHSIYFREPGGVLFEVATLPPGFTVDEPLDHFGESLQLPSWEEGNRKRLESELPTIHLDINKFRD